MSKFWSDILKDRNSDKFSGTKFLGFIGGGLLFLLFVESMFLMWKSTQIDYILVGEAPGHLGCRKTGVAFTDESNLSRVNKLFNINLELATKTGNSKERVPY